MDSFALDSLTQLVPESALRDQVHAVAEQVFQKQLQAHVVPKGCRASERHQQIDITLLVRFIACHGSDEQQRLHIKARELVRVGPNGFDDSLALHDVWKSVRRSRRKAKIKATNAADLSTMRQ
jgi:hypothetical protein